MKEMQTLRQLFDAHRGRLVGKIDHFFDDYEPFLASLRNAGPRVLEIGVHGGGSLELWQAYFGEGAAVHGIDIDPKTRDHCPAGARVHIGSQSDASFLVQLADEFGPFDLVIDDGSHQMSDQRASFELLYPRLTDGGLYICEDAFTSYWQEFGGGLGKPGSFMEFTKQKLDELHAVWSDEMSATWFSDHTRAISILSGAVIFQRGSLAEPRYVSRAGEHYASQPITQLRAAGIERGVQPEDS